MCVCVWERLTLSHTHIHTNHHPRTHTCPNTLACSRTLSLSHTQIHTHTHTAPHIYSLCGEFWSTCVGSFSQCIPYQFVCLSVSLSVFGPSFGPSVRLFVFRSVCLAFTFRSSLCLSGIHIGIQMYVCAVLCVCMFMIFVCVCVCVRVCVNTHTHSHTCVIMYIYSCDVHVIMYVVQR